VVIVKRTKDEGRSLCVRWVEILFGVPWRQVGLKKTSHSGSQRVITYAVTVVLRSYHHKWVICSVLLHAFHTCICTLWEPASGFQQVKADGCWVEGLDEQLWW